MLSILTAHNAVMAGEWSGYLGAEARIFLDDPTDPRQQGNTLSFVAQPEYYTEWDDGNQSLLFIPFARIDQHDTERSHADIRELVWLKAADTWEVHIGIGKVYWGVTESQHLVDIINQTDLVESPDGEEKLGQPMINLSLIRDLGIFDLFVLPGFRERTFPGIKGRLRSVPRIDADDALYESSRKNRHVDWALRWSHTLGDWDIGLSWFDGTSREPRFIPTIKPDGESVLVPFYDQIQQAGLDIQATKEGWLWKLEAINRRGMGETYNALTGGFEYTVVGIASTQADLGLISEYLYDDRDEQALSLFQNDLMLGTRLTLNDEQSTEFLLGLITDLDDSSERSWFIEASRRLGDRWKLNIEARVLSLQDPLNPFHALAKDDFIQLELLRYF